MNRLVWLAVWAAEQAPALPVLPVSRNNMAIRSTPAELGLNFPGTWNRVATVNGVTAARDTPHVFDGLLANLLGLWQEHAPQWKEHKAEALASQAAIVAAGTDTPLVTTPTSSSSATVVGTPAVLPTLTAANTTVSAAAASSSAASQTSVVVTPSPVNAPVSISPIVKAPVAVPLGVIPAAVTIAGDKLVRPMPISVPGATGGMLSTMVPVLVSYPPVSVSVIAPVVSVPVEAPIANVTQQTTANAVGNAAAAIAVATAANAANSAANAVSNTANAANAIANAAAVLTADGPASSLVVIVRPGVTVTFTRAIAVQTSTPTAAATTRLLWPLVQLRPNSGFKPANHMPLRPGTAAATLLADDGQKGSAVTGQAASAPGFDPAPEKAVDDVGFSTAAVASNFGPLTFTDTRGNAAATSTALSDSTTPIDPQFNLAATAHSVSQGQSASASPPTVVPLAISKVSIGTQSAAQPTNGDTEAAQSAPKATIPAVQSAKVPTRGKAAQDLPRTNNGIAPCPDCNAAGPLPGPVTAAETSDSLVNVTSLKHRLSAGSALASDTADAITVLSEPASGASVPADGSVDVSWDDSFPLGECDLTADISLFRPQAATGHPTGNLQAGATLAGASRALGSHVPVPITNAGKLITAATAASARSDTAVNPATTPAVLAAIQDASRAYEDQSEAGNVHRSAGGFRKAVASIIADTAVPSLSNLVTDIIVHGGQRPTLVSTKLSLLEEDLADDQDYVEPTPEPSATVKAAKTPPPAGGAYTTSIPISQTLDSARSVAAAAAREPAEPGPTITSLTGEVAVSNDGWAPALKMHLPFGHPPKKEIPVSNGGWSPARVGEHVRQSFERPVGAIREGGYAVLKPPGTEKLAPLRPHAHAKYPALAKYGAGPGLCSVPEGWSHRSGATLAPLGLMGRLPMSGSDVRLR